MIKRFVLISIVLTLVCACTKTERYYVSLNGNDLGNGSKRHPFATLERARKAVQSSVKSERKIEVVIGEGTYYLDKTIEFYPEDSGTELAPVTWRAAEGEKVVLSGGRLLDGQWQEGNEGIWFLDLPPGRAWKRNLSSAETYEQKPGGSWNFRQLFVDGKRAIRARYPNADEENPFLYASGGSLNHIELAPGQIRQEWGGEEDAQINIVSNWRFFNQRNDVTEVDVPNSAISIGPRERHGKVIEGNWFWIEGVKSELDQSREWYLDTKQGRLYYKPEEGKDPNDQIIIAPYLNRIVYLKGDVENGTHVKYVNFKGLEFHHTSYTLGHMEARVHTDGAVMFENATNCRIDSCHFENIGGYALWLHLDCKHNYFHRNSVLYPGGGGVLLTGSRLSYMDDSKVYTPGKAAEKVAPILNHITANMVSHCGIIRYYGGGVHLDSRPFSMSMEPGNYIGHNHFEDLSRNGIFAFRNQGGNVVEYNHIHDAMQTTIDGAAIHFATMNHLNAPNFILNNWLYDIWGYEHMPAGQPKRHLANGIFLDWATSNTTVQNNTIYNAGGTAIKNIMGNWNLSIADNQVSETRIVPNDLDEVGPQGTASHGVDLEKNRLTGGMVHYSDKELVKYIGNWKPRTITGFWNLFGFSLLEADHSGPAEITYTLPIVEDGIYQISLLYLPDQERNASNARIRINHADGIDNITWDMKQGDKFGFALEIGTYRFEKGKATNVTISNEGADGMVVADAVAFVKDFQARLEPATY